MEGKSKAKDSLECGMGLDSAIVNLSSGTTCNQRNMLMVNSQGKKGGLEVNLLLFSPNCPEHVGKKSCISTSALLGDLYQDKSQI